MCNDLKEVLISKLQEVEKKLLKETRRQKLDQINGMAVSDVLEKIKYDLGYYKDLVHYLYGK